MHLRQCGSGAVLHRNYAALLKQSKSEARPPAYRVRQGATRAGRQSTAHQVFRGYNGFNLICKAPANTKLTLKKIVLCRFGEFFDSLASFILRMRLNLKIKDRRGNPIIKFDFGFLKFKIIFYFSERDYGFRLVRVLSDEFFHPDHVVPAAEFKTALSELSD